MRDCAYNLMCETLKHCQRVRRQQRAAAAGAASRWHRRALQCMLHVPVYRDETLRLQSRGETRKLPLSNHFLDGVGYRFRRLHSTDAAARTMSQLLRASGLPGFGGTRVYGLCTLHL